eukprot:gb/GEZN01005241.1/.p1 GENE.gb/GEZN01005241.1/~~gb/GEZN01005241.1/.p1  ORF type:complete len:454 (+),score=64.25 gb/GEZN01005241.1/:33-1364(+)
MERVVGEILSFSEQQEWEKLKKSSEGWSKMLKKVSNEQLEQGIQSLDFTSHSFGIAHLLYLKSQNEIKNHTQFAEQVRTLCHLGTAPQLRKCAKEFSAICRAMVSSARLSDFPPIRFVVPLQSAISKLQGQKHSLLTPVHADFCQVALRAKLYSVAAPYLQAQPLFEVDKSQGFTALHFLEFNYYAAMLYIGVKEFESALEHLQMTLSIDTQAVSAIQVAAFKKFVLCSLLVHGEVVDVITQRSESNSNYVQRVCRPLCVPYMQLSRAWKQGASEIDAQLTQHEEVLVKDKNLGLAKQLSRTLVRRNIQRLTNTYVTLSLEDIAQHANLETPAQAESYLLSMIEEGTLAAKIDQKRGMIKFLETGESYDTSAMVTKLASKISQLQELSGAIREMSDIIDISPAYLSKTMPDDSEKTGGAPAVPASYAEEEQINQAVAISLQMA